MNIISQDGGGDNKSRSVGVKNNNTSNEDKEPRRPVVTTPPTHGGPTGPPNKSTIQKRRLRTPVWANGRLVLPP